MRYRQPSTSCQIPGTKQGAFTLLEMIVVLAIFAVLGLISSQITGQVVDNFARLTERGDRLAAVQKAMGMLQRDLMQLHNRPIRDTFGDTRLPLVLNPDGSLEFTRLGWQNPLQRPRSNQQRVAYRVEDETLYRYFWIALDQAPDSEPVQQSLLEDVVDVEFLIIDGAGNEHSFWPLSGALPPGQSNPAVAADPTQTMVAVMLRADIAPFGTVERLWAVPQW